MLVTKNAAETKKLAAALAHKILRTQNSKRRTAVVVALVGDLGAGKTTFTQGFAQALGIQNRMTSPTFLIMRVYKVASSKYKANKFKNFYHIDAYRINSPKELTALGFKSLLLSTDSILLIEWADRIKSLLPKDAIWVHFEHGRKENERAVSLRGAKRRGNLTI